MLVGQTRSKELTYQIGIGSAVAYAFAEAGCERIAITDINGDLLKGNQEALQKEFPSAKILAIAGSIAEEKFANDFIDAVVKEFGRIDYCVRPLRHFSSIEETMFVLTGTYDQVNCAGIMGNNQVSTETSLADFDKINNVNYRGCWLTSRAQNRVMLEQEPLPGGSPKRPPQRGSIVNIASQLAIVGRPAAGT
jgi:NAD(P)-dependent dehydrogenase (short-subunit alcohol dehydrogenase family)